MKFRNYIKIEFGNFLLFGVALLLMNFTSILSSNSNVASISGTTQVCKGQAQTPEILFSVDGGVAPYTFVYSINDGPEIVVETIGDSTEKSINVPTNNIGVFIYTLIDVKDGNNSEFSIENSSATITVSKPEVSFTYSNGTDCLDTSVQFNSMVNGIAPFTYEWDFGNGIISNAMNPVHEFISYGCGSETFEVTLKVTDANNCSSSFSDSITVKQSPELRFIDIEAEENFTTPFENCNSNQEDYTLILGNATTDESCISNYSVDWGDGNTDFNVDFPLSHTYFEQGSFIMTVSAEEENGCIIEKEYLVTNSSNPTGGLISPGSTINICLPIDAFEFKISNWALNPPDTVYEVDYGDGTVMLFSQEQMTNSEYYNSLNPLESSNFPIPHEYADSNCPNDPYYLNMKIKTSCGETLLSAGPITTLNKGVADFSMIDSACVNSTILFDNLTTIGYNPDCNDENRYFWDFGDGTTSTQENPIHTYTAPGTYDVSLYSVSFCGFSDTVVKQICVEPQLKPDFSLDTIAGCTPLNIKSINQTDLSNNCSPTNFNWEINFTNDECSDSIFEENWTFLNGTNQNSENPEFNFISPGIYTIKLITSNECGQESRIEEVAVKQPPTILLQREEDYCGSQSIVPTSSLVGCESPEDTLSYSWSFPGGIPSTSDLPNPGTIRYDTPGEYTYSLTISSPCGNSFASETFTINTIPEITNSALNQTTCSSNPTNPIQLEANLPDVTFEWEALNIPSNLFDVLSNGTGNIIPSQSIINNSDFPQTVTYSVTPSYADCLGEPTLFNIVVNPSPKVSLQPVSEVSCINEVLNPLSVAYQNSDQAPAYQWYQNLENNTSSGTPIMGANTSEYIPQSTIPGAIYYYVELNFGSEHCGTIFSDTALIEIFEDPEIENQPLSTQTTCLDGLPKPLSLTLSGGSGNFNYQWYSNNVKSTSGGTPIIDAINASFTPPSTGTLGNYYYYVEVKDNSSDCKSIKSDVAEVVVEAKPEITTQPLQEQALCLNGTPIGLEVQTFGGIGEFTYQWYVNTTPSLDGSIAIQSATERVFYPPADTLGVFYYFIEVNQEAPGCAVFSDFSRVVIQSDAIITSQPQSNTTCLGEVQPPLSISFENGIGTPSYQWFQNSENNTNSGIPIMNANESTYNPDLTSVGTSFYYCVISFSAESCSQIVSEVAEINVKQIPIIDDGSENICSDTSFSYAPNESNGMIIPVGTRYQWGLPVVDPPNSVSGILSQTSPTENITQFLSNNTDTTATVTYTVTPIVGNCSGPDFNVVVTVNPKIKADVDINDNSCFGSNDASIELSLSGGLPFDGMDEIYQVEWIGPNNFTSSALSINNLIAGDYYLKVTDANNCLFESTYTINEPDEFVFNSISFDPETISCAGSEDGKISVEVSGGTIPYSYTWTKDGIFYSNEQNLDNLGPGLYMLTVDDLLNCGSITQTFLVEDPLPIKIDLINKEDILCFGGTDGSIEVNVIGGREDYILTWSGPNSFTSASTNLDNLEAGNYVLIVEDRSGCTETLQVEIFQNEPLQLEYTSTQVSCYGANDSSIAIENISGGISPYTITWGNLGDGNEQNNLSPGIYNLLVEDAVGCSIPVSIEIETPQNFFLDPVVTQLSCPGSNDGRIQLNLVNNLGPASLVWADDPNAGVERNNLSPGTYSVTIDNGTECIIEETFTIFEIEPLKLSAVVTNALECTTNNTGAIDLMIQGGTPPYSFLWSNNGNTEDLQNITAGSYYVNVKDANGCEISGAWEVSRFDPLTVTAAQQINYDCEAKKVIPTYTAIGEFGVPPYQFTWSSGTVSGPNNSIMTPSENGLVLLEITDSLGCTNSHSFDVNISEIGEEAFSYNSLSFSTYGRFSIQDPISFTNNSTGDYNSISWDFGDGNFSTEENPTHTYMKQGNFTVTLRVSYEFGCVFTEEVILNIGKGYSLIFPNSFTPNGDKINDYFVMESIGLNNMQLDIYDTWGNLIYSETGDNLLGWDGKVNGYMSQNGTYYYTFSAKTIYDQTINEKGGVILLN